MSQNLRSFPSLVTQCHASSTPSAPIDVWRNLWMPPYYQNFKCFRSWLLKVHFQDIVIFSMKFRVWYKNAGLTYQYQETYVNDHLLSIGIACDQEIIKQWHQEDYSAVTLLVKSFTLVVCFTNISVSKFSNLAVLCKNNLLSNFFHFGCLSYKYFAFKFLNASCLFY